MTKDINVSLENLGTTNKNVVTISTKEGAVNLYFSYKTLIAVNGLTSINEWSKTTGKFLNELEPNKENRKPHEEILKEAQKQIKGILYTDKEQIIESLKNN